jgi:rhodanese-related sulfurtransferase
MKLCLQCVPLENDSKKVVTTIRGKADWIQKNPSIHGLPPNAKLPDKSRQSFPTNSDVRITCFVPQFKNKKILFWAAQARQMSNRLPSPLIAYTKNPQQKNFSYPNFGVTFIKNHVLSLKLRAPRPYIENGVAYAPHVHFAVENKRLNKWEGGFTIPAFPFHSKYYTMKSLRESDTSAILTPSQVSKLWNKLIKVNALPYEYPSIEKKGSKSKKNVHLPYNSSKSKIQSLAKTLKNNPYVVYCAHGKCNAASDLIFKLVSFGATNVYYMPAGKRGWKRFVNKT